jgi:hypothetical protein
MILHFARYMQYKVNAFVNHLLVLQHKKIVKIFKISMKK